MCYPAWTRTRNDRTKNCSVTNYTTGQYVDQVGIEPTTFTLWVCRSNRVSYKSKIVRVDGFEPPKSKTPDLQSGANYRIDNTPKKPGKEKMVQWTTPFMIGITNVGLNSDVFGHTTNRLTHTIPQSTFARMSGLEPETPSFGD